jgi:hypothetical protein
MKRWYILFLIPMLIFSLFLNGCGGNPPPKTGHYTMAFSTSGGEVVSVNLPQIKNQSGVVYAAGGVNKEPSWWITRTETDFLAYCNFAGNPVATAVQVWIRDGEGQLIDMEAAEAEDYITWTSPDELDVVLGGDLNMLGASVSFVPQLPKVYEFTATFNGDAAEGRFPGIHITKTCQVVVLNSPRIDPYGISATLQTGFDFSAETGTDNAADWDVTYVNVAGENKISAPYGIVKLVDPENDGIDEGISGKILGSILQVPAGLDFSTTQLPCEAFAHYAIRTKEGGYAKFMNTVWPATPTNRTYSIYYEHGSPFNLHW